MELGHVWNYVKTCFKEVCMLSCFVKQFTRTALTSLVELVEPNLKKSSSSKVELCQIKHT
jgi:hypothetical protein